MHTTTRPCRNKPGFLQPGEYPFWHLQPETVDAQSMCLVCPARQQCAREALDGPTPDGVVQAAVICRGDARTLEQLRQIAGERPKIAEVIDLDALRLVTHCGKCRRRLVRRSATPRLGEARRGARGLCKSCHTLAARAGELQPRPTIRPTSCNGCHLPMVARKRTPPPGHVEHEGGGYCRTCVSARRYAQGAAA